MVDVEGAAAREPPPEHDAKPGRLCLQPTGDQGFESFSLQRRVYCELDFGHDDGRYREDRPKPATGCRQAPRERPRRSLRLKLVHEASTVPRSGCTIAERLA